MNKYLLMIVLAISSLKAIAQQESVLLSERVFLEINFTNKSYGIKTYKFIEHQHSDCIESYEQEFSSGDVIILKNVVICRNKYIVLKLRKVAEFTYLVLNKNKYVRSGKLLHTSSYASSKITIKHMHWENNLKNGVWYYFDIKKSKNYFIKYKDGRVIDTTYIHPEIPNKIW